MMMFIERTGIVARPHSLKHVAWRDTREYLLVIVDADTKLIAGTDWPLCLLVADEV